MKIKNKKVSKIGMIVNTHGIKGELKIKSGFHFSNNDFVLTKHIYVENKTYEIINYRFHNGFHMIKLKNFSNINDVLFLKGKDVYIDEKFLKTTNFDQIIGKQVLLNDGTKIGVVKSIMENKKYKILELSNDQMIPFIKHFIVKETKNEIWIKNYDQI